MRSLELVPELAERVRAGRREERYGASDLPNFYRKPFGAAWAQVGDAGLHKADATRFIKARMGMTDPAAFFNPQNLQQLLAGAEPSMT